MQHDDAMVNWYTPLSALLRAAPALAVLEDELPEVMGGTAPVALAAFPVGAFLQFVLRPDDARAARVLARLARVPDPAPRPPALKELAPSPNYEEEDVLEGSASIATASGAVNEPTEIRLHGPSHGNPFIDVELSATVRDPAGALRTIGGFYDGEGEYRVRVLPELAGTWQFTIASNARSLNALAGSFEVMAGSAPGPVRVQGDGFARSDGSPFLPIGTTAYAWTHQPDLLQEQTLRSLADAPFNKLRMALFPKSYLYSSNEPERYVFQKAEDGRWDLERFDLDYFRHLERRIEQLGAIGVDADLILFHPYDRWGFADLGPMADDRYVRYVVRRFAAYPNVWWALANEYELLSGKRPADWDRIGRLVEREDPVGHPRSIHNIVRPWDPTSDWVTHSSIQAGVPSVGERVLEARFAASKPVVVDEMGYEGDLDQGWGNLPAEEFVLRCWDVLLHGGYFTHGETFWSPDSVIFWAKGGSLRGESPARVRFMREIVASAPAGCIHPLPSEFDATWAGVENQWMLIYFGRGRPRFRNVPLPPRQRARIAVIDTWNMTIDEVPGIHEGTVLVELPAQPWMAIRLVLEPS
jgi:hypothetical protein